MILREENSIDQNLSDIANKMLSAAVTAPKGKGKNTLEAFICSGEELDKLADKMDSLARKYKADFFSRDANNLRNSNIVLILGTRFKSLGLQEICGYCGFNNCVEKDKHPDKPCSFNTTDLGIAVGSAVSIANNNFIDNRVMFSVGKAAIENELFESDIKIAYGIPLSATAKNIYYDR